VYVLCMQIKKNRMQISEKLLIRTTFVSNRDIDDSPIQTYG